jgi:hypothetical protein
LLLLLLPLWHNDGSTMEYETTFLSAVQNKAENGNGSVAVISSNQFNDDGDDSDRVVVVVQLLLVVRSPPLWSPRVVVRLLLRLVFLFVVVDIVVWLLLSQLKAAIMF